MKSPVTFFCILFLAFATSDVSAACRMRVYSTDIGQQTNWPWRPFGRGRVGDRPVDSALHVVTLHVRSVLHGQQVFLNRPLRTVGGDTLVLSTLRFYLGKFSFWKNDTLVFRETNRYRLVDWEDANSQIVAFTFPVHSDFDSLSFDLGVDSLTTVAGSMDGDLDPTKGMFWAWQSGYINVKIEGQFSQCPARGGVFDLHLGGYLPPFQTVQTVGLRRRARGDRNEFALVLELAPLLENIAWDRKTNVMSPGSEAVRLSVVLAKSFNLYAP